MPSKVNSAVQGQLVAIEDYGAALNLEIVFNGQIAVQGQLTAAKVDHAVAELLGTRGELERYVAGAVQQHGCIGVAAQTALPSEVNRTVQGQLVAVEDYGAALDLDAIVYDEATGQGDNTAIIVSQCQVAKEGSVFVEFQN